MKSKQYINDMVKREEALSEENREKFDILLLKIRFAHMDEKDGEEFLNSCMDVFSEAEQKGILPEELLGTCNLEEFTENFIRKCRNGYSFLKRIYWEISYIPLVLLLYLGVFEMGPEMVQYWREYGFSQLVRVNTGMLINTLIVLMLINLLLSRLPALYIKINSTDKAENRKCFFQLWLLLVFFIFVSVIVKRFMSVYMFQINYFIFLGVLLILCILQNILEQRN
ncbi:MAG: hypothetical protein HFI34_04180 [Lachnospiraceae bacterium]|nr:hypothetical protein [Lachnospiraceae bacterium]